MDIQAPEALGFLKKTLDGLLDPAPPGARRGATTGD
jgi:hypothetical protein